MAELLPNGGAKSVYQPTNQQTNHRRTTVSAETVAPGATKRPRKTWRDEKREIIKAIADAALRVNAPPVGESGKDILAGIIGHLLGGGYDAALITRVAVNAVSEYDEIRRYSKLFQLRMRVRAEQAKIDLDAHNKQKKLERDDLAASQPLATLADLRRLDPRRPIAERQGAAIIAAERLLYPTRAAMPEVKPS